MDQQQADHLMEVLDANLKDNEGVNVILDMGQLLYMNSTGLNIMISVLTRTRKAGGQVLLAAISHGVRQLFVVTKLDTVFPILDTVELALAKLRA
jgi:anti-sigma B factor antagonist